ncbi:MAG: COX15/CtaA family protein, partial [Caldilineaceae bacterium]|nr:COX15/CtaA family protein [Caldilineaceae bacterium]
NATTIHFVHRWFAFAVLAIAAVLVTLIYRSKHSHAIRYGAFALGLLIGVQIGLGMSVIWMHVPLTLALLHQLTAVLLFLVALFLVHRLRAA